MELVYLWVEDYKNIKNQGFNFSQNFDVKFTPVYENNKLSEKSELKIIPKVNPLKDFFGKDINVTAIVGENGSGKSSVLEAFIDSLSENFLKYLEDDKARKYIVVYKYKNEYYYLLSTINNVRLIDSEDKVITWIKKNPNQKLLDWHSDIFTLILQNEISPKRIFHNDKQVVIEHMQADKNRAKRLIVSNLMQNPTFKKDSNKFFTPQAVQIKINWNKLFNKLEDKGKYEEEVFNKLESKVNEAKEFFKNNKNKECFEKIFEICNIKTEQLKKSKLLFTVQTDSYMSNLFEAEKNCSWLSKVMANYPIKDVIENLNQFTNLIFKIETITPDIIDFLFDLPDYIFQIELKDNNKTFEDLSFGERQLLSQLHFILHYATQKKSIQYEGVDYSKDDDGNEHEVDIDYEQKIKSMIVLLDEFEIGLHPNWQKKAIFYIMDFLQNIKDVDFNLLFTSHSPFILSDIPKENVIFLEKYDDETEKKYPKLKKDGLENGNCINVSKHIELKTFGANIHTLLSHGFFMSDGLMGEFAKSKIEEIKKFYELIQKLQNKGKIKNKNLWKKSYERRKIRFENIQKIIGEPFLQTIIKNYLDELEILFNGKKEFLDKEIKRLQALQESLND